MGKGAGDIVDKVTLNIGTIKGGVKVNMVPSSAVFETDIRLPLGVTRERVLAEVEKILKDFPDATVKETNCNLPPGSTPTATSSKSCRAPWRSCAVSARRRSSASAVPMRVSGATATYRHASTALSPRHGLP